MNAVAFVQKPPRGKPQPIYVLHGDEHFLKRRVLAILKERVLGTENAEFSLSTFPGDKTPYATVHDELRTLPFLSSRRLVVVENADPFVSKERSRIEKYAQTPSTTGVLVLDMKTWASNTKLAKMLPDQMVLDCKSLPMKSLPKWCVDWCQTCHEKHLSGPAAQLLVDLVGADMGLLDQEMVKLATYVGNAGRIEARDVDRIVGSSRTENTFLIFDLIASGQTARALSHLDHLFIQGEEPIRLLGAFSWQLRPLAQAARLSLQGVPLTAALTQAGVPPYGRRRGEQMLRHLGPQRASALYDWLLDLDQGLKSSNQLSPRLLFERLVIRLARDRAKGTAV